ncbi:hypothetical protein H6P81_008168 [Aristolochia fimbriata]|uniref:Epidermal patterning factor-like protein n=1 Tax=Aristolochia fimbriata TaxID=158543 RepID=A0AAV7F5J1_ARIFI|nr:hypothetical protein H6P81_008166 [Aristolochia fimbriata]KAG9455264.1 hypothetical protein H6P81_008168 [Aristolochia fimbriata]
MSAAQKHRVWLMLIFLLLIKFWEAATSRPVPPIAVDEQGLSAYYLKYSRRESKRREEAIGTQGFRGVDNVGSRPPSCDHKCGGCVPCSPTQVPTTSDQIGLQYSNYVPEGWKCKCGTYLYNP